MKLLGLIRHAKSDWDDMGLRDFDRGLNDRGRQGAALMGDHIRDHGVKWDRVVASPAERVKRTLDASGLDVPVTFEDRAYLADSTTLQLLLQTLDGNPEKVMLAAHNPGLQELALDMVAKSNEDALYDEVLTKYPTASFCVLELDIDDWSKIRPRCGRIVHFARPRDLDPALGPVA